MPNTIEAQLRDKARELLASGQVECVIGYERATDGVGTRPAFVYAAEEANRLVFDETCTHTLVKYLLDKKGRTCALVVKPCDARSLNVLLAERQVPRARVVVLGMACPGVKVRGFFGEVGAEWQTRCQECVERVPGVYDFLARNSDPAMGNATVNGSNPDASLGEGQPPASERSTSRKRQMVRLEGMPPAEKAAFWASHFARCLRCYACRQVCPGCYCTECFVEQLDPEWVGLRNGPAENQIFHTIRAFHLAGRCAGCDECERVCPVNIPLSLLNHKLDQEVVEMFDHHTGASAETPAPLFAFRPDEKLGAR